MYRAGRVLNALLISIGLAASPKVSAAQQTFSVRNSIEMTVFSDPYTRNQNAVCQQSPDKRWAFVVTTRGDLSTDRLESKLWLFDMRSVSAYLAQPKGNAPAPQLLAVQSVVPRAKQYQPYGAVISKAQWASDSRAILFLAEQPSGKQRLYRLSILAHMLRPVTSSSKDIEDYSEAAGVTVYTVRESKAPKPDSLPGIPINSMASVVTGLPLASILQPETLLDHASLKVPRDIWVLTKSGERIRINISSGRDEWHVPSALSAQFRPALSPDGSALIAAMPAKSLPSPWLGYQFASDKYSFEKLTVSADPSGTVWSWPWQYIYVDLRTGRTQPLVDAPSAMQAGYYDPFLSNWSADGRKALFTSSFLPRADRVARDTRAPCAVAVFDLLSRATECVVETRFPKQNAHLVTARFGASSGEIVIEWATPTGLQTEIYRKGGDGWNLESGKRSPAATRDISLFIKQDLDVPPTLWALQEQTGLARELWNPNPALADMQLGSTEIYQWDDSTGYDWKGALLKPPGYIPGHRYPLVIQTHGFFNEHEFITDGAYTSGFAARPLAAAGIMVLQMGDRTDRHISPASKEAELMATAYRDAIRSMDRDGLIKPREVGIIGFSRTSWYVETALIRYPALFNAATIIDGVDQSYITYMLFCPEYPECRVDHEAANGGPPFGHSLQNWLSTADGFNLTNVQTPLLIEAIGSISVLGEWETYSSLRMQGKSVKLVYIPAGQHILQKPLERLASQQGTVEWFIQHFASTQANSAKGKNTR